MATRRQRAFVMSFVPLVIGDLYVTITFPFDGWVCHPDDTSQYPVMAPGFTSPLFAQTVAPDRTFITPSGEGAPHNNSVNVQDLPAFFLSHQAAEGQPAAGSSCWQFNHSDGDLTNCTENVLFATVGLLNSSQVTQTRIWILPSLQPATHCRVVSLLGARSGSASLRGVQKPGSINLDAGA